MTTTEYAGEWLLYLEERRAILHGQGPLPPHLEALALKETCEHINALIQQEDDHARQPIQP